MQQPSFLTQANLQRCGELRTELMGRWIIDIDQRYDNWWGWTQHFDPLTFHGLLTRLQGDLRNANIPIRYRLDMFEISFDMIYEWGIAHTFGGHSASECTFDFARSALV
jgi:hypothetical protein